MRTHPERVKHTGLFVGLGVFGFLCLLPLLSSQYYVYFFAEVIIWALFALSFNLLLGHSGMLSLGHATFFGIGAYTYALLVKKAALPMFVALGAAPVVGLVAALIIGCFCVRTREVYFSFLTLALGQMVYLILYRWYSFTNGEDGIVGLPVPNLLANITSVYYFSLIVSAVCFCLLLTITNSPLGTILHAIRDNPERVKFSGLKVARFQIVSFGIAGFFAAVAGTLYVTLTKAAFIEYVGLDTCVMALFACLLGGMRTFYGPLIGATIIVALDKQLGTYTQYWSAVTGVSVIMIAIAFPTGILGYLKQKVVGKSQA
jgi:branched-chain amino acid transport system permease protein